MRISKTAAMDLAYAALKDRYDEHEKREDDLKKYFETVVLKYTPEEVKILFKSSHREYLESSTGYLQIFSPDKPRDHRSFHTLNSVPHKSHTRQLKVSDSEFDKLIKWDVSNKAFKESITKDRKALETALVQLGTYKRIRETIPEMTPFLPTSETTAIVPDMSEIRQILGQK